MQGFKNIISDWMQWITRERAYPEIHKLRKTIDYRTKESNYQTIYYRNKEKQSMPCSDYKAKLTIKFLKKQKLKPTKISWLCSFKGPKTPKVSLIFETMAMNFSWGLAAQVPHRCISWQVNNADSKVILQHITFKKTYKKWLYFKSDNAGR